MSASDSTPSLPLSPAHVAMQFDRRGTLEAPQFLYGEVARRMMTRLSYIRLEPRAMLDAGCGAGANFPLLRERFPQAAYTGLDHAGVALAHARGQYGGGKMKALLGRLTGQTAATTTFIQADLAHTGLAAESMDLVWSNLALHWHHQPHDVLAEWQRILKVQALAMFSCMGPATLRELRDALNVAGLQTRTPTFVDMHDFGDLLVEKGFADPVMDQETLTLTYRTPERLLEDVRALGGNPSTSRRAALTTRHWRQRLLDALEAQRGGDGLIKLTIEVAYGHAWRTATRRASATETHFSVDAIGGRTRHSTN